MRGVEQRDTKAVFAPFMPFPKTVVSKDEKLLRVSIELENGLTTSAPSSRVQQVEKCTLKQGLATGHEGVVRDLRLRSVETVAGGGSCQRNRRAMRATATSRQRERGSAHLFECWSQIDFITGFNSVDKSASVNAIPTFSAQCRRRCAPVGLLCFSWVQLPAASDAINRWLPQVS